MSEKRFYWIKLKTDFFNQETIDFLMSQENGSDYVVLYQMLCLKTANNGGEMSTRIGEMIVPYDVKKIVREAKYFCTDTVMVALELFKQIGLVYMEDNGVFRIANYGEMVGSETSSAKRVREHRARKALQSNGEVTQEIELRDKSIEIEKDKDKEKEEKRKRFIPPTVEEVEAYCRERQNGINAQQFCDFYASKGWRVGNQPMRDWKAAVRTWEQRNGRRGRNGVKIAPPKQDDISLEGIF